MRKLIPLVLLAPSAWAGPQINGNQINPASAITVSSVTVSNTLGVGISGAASNGTLVVQSTSTTSGNPIADFRNNSGTSVLKATQGGAVVASGSVGIGTATPASLFQVGASSFAVTSAGATTVNAGAGAAGLTVNGAANQWASVTNGSGTTGQSFGPRVIAGSNSSDASYEVRDYTGVNTYFKVRGDGNVGIGTASPQSKLHVEKASNDTISAGNAAAAFVDTTIGAGLYLQQLASSPFGFSLQGANPAFSSQFPIILNKGGGNVGIGTTSPCSTCTLHVNGGIASNGTVQAHTIKFDDGSSMTTAASGSAGGNNTWTGSNVYNGLVSISTWSAVIVTPSGTQTSFATCMATVTITLQGSTVTVAGSGSINVNTSADLAAGALEDGKFLGNESATLGLVQNSSGGSGTNLGFNRHFTGRTAGQHNYCIGFWTSAGTMSAAAKSEYSFEAKEEPVK